MLPPELCFGVFFLRVNFSLPLLQLQQMELCLPGAPKAVERFMPSMRRMDKYFGQCRWRTVITVHRRSPEVMFTFRMPARRHMPLTPYPVSNGGTTIAVAKEAAARRPSCTTG